jgi:hypothetical protein
MLALTFSMLLSADQCAFALNRVAGTQAVSCESPGNSVLRLLCPPFSEADARLVLEYLGEPLCDEGVDVLEVAGAGGEWRYDLARERKGVR